MANDICLSCEGPILTGDRVTAAVVGELNGLVHYTCFREKELKPVTEEAVVKAWGIKVSDLPDPVQLTCDDALEAWDAGRVVFTVSMGGLGPSHEQAIHIAAMELVRYMTTIEELPPETDEKGNKLILHHLRGLMERYELSEFMENSAINLAFMTKRLGWRAAVRAAPPSRLIQITKFFPEGER